MPPSSAAIFLAGTLFGATAMAAEPTTATVTGHIYQPAAVEPTPERIAQLKLPDGFHIQPFAENLQQPRMMVAAPGGGVYVTQPKPGNVLLLRDSDGDGTADERRTVVEQDFVHGIALHDGYLYLVTVHEVLRGALQDDGNIGELTVLRDDLPDGGQHPNRTIDFGPDGMMYVTIGSLANVYPTPANDHTAVIMRAQPDGSDWTVHARGLRNTIGFDWHPASGELYGMDHGIDWLGDNQPPEELNHIMADAHYGWPYVYGDRQDTPQLGAPPGTTWEAFAAQSEPSLLGYTSHAAPLQMTFYTGDHFPAEYRNDAFIAMRGSWNRRPPAGYEVVRIRFDEAGQPQDFQPFLTGFLIQGEDGEYSHFARLAGLTMTEDGSLLVGDDTNGLIYRISYEG